LRLVERGGSSADEVDYLEFVALMDRGLGPGGARDDLSVVLYRDPIAFQAEFGDKLFEGGWLKV
jgi:hypothetical protein